MIDYRCYFFGPGTSSFGAPSSIEAAEDLRAETDDEARMAAEVMYRQRRNQIHGFELWQAKRLVHRRLGASGECRPPESQRNLGQGGAP